MNLEGLSITVHLIIVGVLIILAWILIMINKHIFKKIRENRKELHLLFFERLIMIVIMIGCVICIFASFGGIGSIWKTMLGGTAIISAVAAFAAQDVLKDILAGLMLSIHKPFEVGNRIELEDGTVGIVKDMNTRQVILKGPDSLHIILPNSKVAAMRIRNLSFGKEEKAIYFRFAVGYDSDLKKAKEVIEKAVIESPYSVPEELSDGSKKYMRARFMEFADSALIIMIMVLFPKEYSSEDVIDDINTRVREAIVAAGIEIPYNYMNVVVSENK